MAEIITDKEMEKLVMALALGSKSFTEDEAKEVIKWAETTRIQSNVLDMVLKGSLVLSFKNKEMMFNLIDKMEKI